MKKVLASATILSLMLVGCSNGGNDESSHKDDSSKTEQKDKSSTQKKIRNVMIQIISKTIRKITLIKNKQIIKIQMMENNEQAKDQQQIQTEIHRIIKINNSNQYKITRINM